MAWVASHLFVRCGEHAAAREAIARLLADDGHRADPAGMAGTPPRIVISPPRNDWTVIAGASHWLDDLVWAAGELSRDCGDVALSCELSGHAYRLRLSEHRNGQRQHLLHTPDLEWSSPGEHRGPMPQYDDAEDRAFRTLRALGIPPELILIGTQPLGAIPEAQPLGVATQLWVEEGRVETATTKLVSCAAGVDTTPVLPGEISHQIGTVLFDNRYVEGHPTDQAVDRLLELEQHLLDRTKRADPNSTVSVTLTYHGGSNQPKLDTHLRARGRHVPPTTRRQTPPWWQFWRHIRFGRRSPR